MNPNTHVHSGKKDVFDGVPYIIFFHVLDAGRTNPKANVGDGMCFYTAYIKIPEDHPWIKFLDQQRYFDIGLTSWKLKKSEAKKKGLPFTEPRPKSRRHYHRNINDIDINVHGGLSFGDKVTSKEVKYYAQYQGFDEGYWIGWDYGHAGDYNHDHEWHQKLMKSTDPAEVKLGNNLNDIHVELDRKFPHLPKANPFNDHDWTLEEVEAHCLDAIAQLRKAQNGTK